jgi:phosphohistidine phosphatase
VICYFVRHGIAADAEAWEGSDFDRPLTAKGRKQMARVAKRLSRIDIEVDTIVTSPLLRAKQTAEILADALGAKKRLIEDDRLGGGFDLRALAGILRDREGLSAVMLVGHEPSMSAVSGDVIGGGRLEFKKGAIACVDLFDHDGVPRGELLWLVTPRTLDAL